MRSSGRTPAVADEEYSSIGVVALDNCLGETLKGCMIHAKDFLSRPFDELLSCQTGTNHDCLPANAWGLKKCDKRAEIGPVLHPYVVNL
jgi:hypothetical protein